MRLGPDGAPRRRGQAGGLGPRRKWNLWSYIDARDAAQVVRKSLEAPITGAEAFIIASPDIVMKRIISELID